MTGLSEAFYFCLCVFLVIYIRTGFHKPLTRVVFLTYLLLFVFSLFSLLFSRPFLFGKTSFLTRLCLFLYSKVGARLGPSISLLV